VAIAAGFAVLSVEFFQAGLLLLYQTQQVFYDRCLPGNELSGLFQGGNFFYFRNTAEVDVHGPN
jgi:hypothetical protein